jgi:hypothetical protein
LVPLLPVRTWQNDHLEERDLGIDAGDDSVVALFVCPRTGFAPAPGIMTV